MIKLYRIKDWDTIYENSKSRTIRNCSWCPIPSKQDGLGYGLIMVEDDGTAIYGAFIAVVLMCSKQSMPRRGYLTDTGMPDGRPLTPKELSVKTKVPHVIIERMLSVTSSESIGWMESVTDVSPTCHDERPEGNRREQKGTEGKGREGKEQNEGKAHSMPDYPPSDLPEIEDYPDLYAIADPIVAAIAVTGGKKKQDWGFWVRVKENARKAGMSEGRVNSRFMECVEKLYGEMRCGEINNPPAQLNNYLKERFNV